MNIRRYIFIAVAGVPLLGHGKAGCEAKSVSPEPVLPCAYRFEMRACFDGKCRFLASLNEVTPLLITRGLLCASLYEEIVAQYKARIRDRASGGGRNEIRRFHEDILSGTGDVGELRWCRISGGIDSAADGRRSPLAILELLSSAVCVSSFKHDSGRYIAWLRKKGMESPGCDVVEQEVYGARALRVRKCGFAQDVFVASLEDGVHFIAGSRAALEERIALQRKCGLSAVNMVPRGDACVFEVDDLGSLMVCAEKVYGEIVAERVSQILGDADFRKFGALKLRVMAYDSCEEKGMGIAELIAGSKDDADIVCSSLKFQRWKGIIACTVMSPFDVRAAEVLKILKDTEIDSEGVKVRVELPVTASIVELAVGAIKDGWPGGSKL